MYTMRFEPKINAVKALVESGALGDINNVYFVGLTLEDFTSI